MYARHGAPANQFGVSFAHLNQLKKRIGRDQELADALWTTANADARILACMVADAASFDRAQLDAWVDEIQHYVLCDVFASNVAARSPQATQTADRWIASDREFVAAAGWDVISCLAMREAPDVHRFTHLLDRIADEIHSAPNRTRHAMNMALIAIGGSHPVMEAHALKRAAEIGRVEVDHGATSCKTPDAAGYIARMAARRARAAGGGKKSAGTRPSARA